MIATILNVAPNGQAGVTVSFSITDDKGKLLDFPYQFNGITCINMNFALPLTDDPVGELEATINSAVLERLNKEFLNSATTSATRNVIDKVSSDLVLTTISVTSINVGSIKLDSEGVISAIPTVPPDLIGGSGG